MKPHPAVVPAKRQLVTVQSALSVGAEPLLRQFTNELVPLAVTFVPSEAVTKVLFS